MEVCHIDKCEPCILSKTRTCPCGKSYYQLPCDEDTPTCGDTCGKVLECGLHFCNQRCHKDKCGIVSISILFVSKFLHPIHIIIYCLQNSMINKSVTQII